MLSKEYDFMIRPVRIALLARRHESRRIIDVFDHWSAQRFADEAESDMVDVEYQYLSETDTLESPKHKKLILIHNQPTHPIVRQIMQTDTFVQFEYAPGCGFDLVDRISGDSYRCGCAHGLSAQAIGYAARLPPLNGRSRSILVAGGACPYGSAVATHWLTRRFSDNEMPRVPAADTIFSAIVSGTWDSSVSISDSEALILRHGASTGTY